MVENKHSLPITLDSSRKTSTTLSLASQLWDNTFENLTSFVLNDPAVIEKNLEKIAAEAKMAWLKMDDQPLHKGLIQTVYNLELSENYWNKAIGGDQKKAEAIIVHLEK